MNVFCGYGSLGGGPQRDEIQASIRFEQTGGKMQRIKGGPQSRLCVLVDLAAAARLEVNKDEKYMIVKGH